MRYTRAIVRLSHFDYRQIGSYVLVAIVFIVVSYVVREYQSDIGLLFGNQNALSIALFVLLTILFVVFVIPLDIVFLVPLGVSLWGPVPTALLMITGWTLGAGIAFLVARRCGSPIVARLVGSERVMILSERIPPGELFWSVVFLRLVVPVDILSYALGLFSQLSLGRYLLATVIGITPFGFFFSFAGALPFWYQIIALTGALALASFLLVRYGRKNLYP